MPIPACCISEFYAKSALLYSKGGLCANDVGIKLPHVYDLFILLKGKFYAKVINP